MTQRHAGFDELKVVSVGQDGRRRFDVQAKRKLIAASLHPDVSVASLALKHGVNANLLHKWIRKHQRRQGSGVVESGVEPALSAFVPVVEQGGADLLAEQPRPVAVARDRGLPRPRAGSRLSAQFPNGILLTLECAGQDARLVSALIETLGRCHVPSGR